MSTSAGGPVEAQREDLMRDLRAVFAAGTAKYGLAGLSWDIFAAGAIEALAERLGESGMTPTPQRFREALRLCPHADFVLLVASRAGDREEAMAAFRRVHGDRLVNCYLQLGARADEAADLAAELLEALTFGAFRRSGKPAFLTYGALAPIEHWLAGFARHDWMTRRRARARSNEVAETEIIGDQETALSAAVPARRDTTPEARELGRLVREALQRAVETGAVPARDVHAFAAWMVLERPQFELAALLEVDPATFSRRKSRGQEALARCVREDLLLRLSGPEFITLCRDTNLELSETNLALYQPIREFCRWALDRLERDARPGGKGESASTQP